MSAPLLRVRGLRASFPAAGGAVRALDGVSFDLARARVLGVVGESGCGKTTLACAVAGLPQPGERVEGDVLLGGEDVLRASPAALRRLRGRVGMVFQEPAAHLDPVFTVGSQLCETLRLRARLSHTEARAGGCGRAGAPPEAVPPRALRRPLPAGDDRPGAVRGAGAAGGR